MALHASESCHGNSLRYCEQFGSIFIKSHLVSKSPISTWHDHIYISDFFLSLYTDNIL